MKSPQPTQDCALSAQTVTVSYGKTPVLHGVGLDVARGAFTVLIGPNGSGKSTLLGAMARMLPLDAGHVILDGRDIAALPTKAVARQLGLLPQQAIPPEGLTVTDLVARGRYPHQGLFRQWSHEDEAAVGRALSIAGLTDLAVRDVDSLSGGQRQRVWIAMVLAQDTPVMLLDEPTSYLDIHHQIEILSMLRRLVQDHGRTVVCVLHDLNLALQYADHLVFLQAGRIHARLEHPSECTAQLVQQVFNTPVAALSHPETGLPLFVPVSR